MRIWFCIFGLQQLYEKRNTRENHVKPLWALMGYNDIVCCSLSENNSCWVYWDSEQGYDDVNHRSAVLSAQVCPAEDETARCKYFRQNVFGGSTAVVLFSQMFFLRWGPVTMLVFIFLSSFSFTRVKGMHFLLDCPPFFLWLNHIKGLMTPAVLPL